MTATDRRIDNLFDGLAARERAVLAIQAWKEGQKENPRLRWTLPAGQQDEFYDLISQARAIGLLFSSLTPIWREAAEKHRAWHGCLRALELSEIYVSSLSRYILTYTREEITESQHAALITEERAKMLPLAELAESLAGDYDEWRDSDLEDGYVRDRAFARITKEKKALLVTLFEDGTIAGRRKGKGIELNAGSFSEWLGRPIPIRPGWGDYQIVPDAQEEESQRANAARDHARTMIQRALGGSTARALGQEPDEDDVYAALEKELAAGIIANSCEIHAADMLVGEFQQRLGGEDPLDPEGRESLDYCRGQLAKMREDLGVDAELAIDDCDANLRAMREFIETEL